MVEGMDTSGINIPFWFSDCKIPPFPKLQENISTEICIIGGGIIGLTTAYQLCLEGKKVVLLEDGHLISGETGRTSGHLCSSLDDYYYKLEQMYGEQGCKLIAKSHANAIDFIENTIRTEKIECDFQRLNGYLFLGPKNDSSILEKEKEAATKAGLKTELLLDFKMGNLNLGSALKFYDQARFHPLKYLGSLANVIYAKGGQIYAQTHASEIKVGKKVKITTADGFNVTAEKVVIATNAPIFDKALLFSKQGAYRTYVIGMSIENADLEDALFWDTEEPYHYLRLNQLNNNQTILSIGGEDHKTGQNKHEKEQFKKLEQWARKKIPGLGKVEYTWSGQVMEPVDYLAFIGIDPTNEKNIFVATGDSGNGLTHGTIAATLLTDEIMNRTNPYQEIYKPTRKPIKNLGSLLALNLDNLIEYTKYFTPSEITQVSQIKKGEGAVIRKGLKKIAVYRDPQNNLHYCSAICPHLKGIITWNIIEKSWDCPVHGSRFNPLGKVMNGPANSDLEKETRDK